MNSYELNKIFGAILATLVFVMGIGLIADSIYKPIENRGDTHELPAQVVAEAPAEAATDEAAGPTINELMQTASADAGAALIRRCQACHDYSETNANKTGPGIYDLLGKRIAPHADFAYSADLKTMGDEGKLWDYANLDAFLEAPKTFAPGTKMSFAGLKKPEDRANLIAFMRTLSPSPIALPEAN